MIKRMRGVTLVEALIVVLLASIVLAMATPNLKDFVRKNKSTAVTNQMLSYVSLARSEAAKRNYNVVLCVRNDAGSGCHTSSKDFAKGIFMFVDYSDLTNDANNTFDGANVQFDLDADGTVESFEEMIFTSEPLSTSFTIASNGSYSVANAPSSIVFSSSGSVKGLPFSIVIKHLDNAELAGKVTVNNSGRWRACVVRPGNTCS